MRILYAGTLKKRLARRFRADKKGDGNNMDMQKCMNDNQNKGFIALAAEKICGGIKLGIDKCVSAYMKNFGVKKYQAESFCEGASGDMTPWTDKSVDTASEYLRELVDAAELKRALGIAGIAVGSAAVIAGVVTGITCCVKKQKSERKVRDKSILKNIQTPHDIGVAIGH